MARVVAGVGTALILAALLLAAHSREHAQSSASVVTPLRCTKLDGQRVNVFRDGFTLECGQGSAVVRSDGRWHVMKAGDCVPTLDGEWVYFGVHTSRHVPHTGLTLHTHAREHRPGQTYEIDGYIETKPSVEESVSGTAVSESGGVGGVFILHGGTSGHTYTGSWDCEGHK